MPLHIAGAFYFYPYGMDINALYECFLEHRAISTDTRKIIPGSMFFALKGEHFDGNTFAANAIEQGAAVAVVSDPSLEGEAYLHVSDTLKALQDLARMHRQHLSIPVIAITGSNGKTTTKELLHAVLSKKYKVHATKGNLNNHIGVPLTILSTPVDTELLICEMGANHPGEIDFLCRMAEPTHGLITNIGRAHIEGFGSFEGVRQAKGELYAYLNHHEGLAFVNLDDPSLASLSPHLPRKVTYGLKEDTHADIHFRFESDRDGIGFHIRDRHGSFSLTSPLFGDYNAMNVLAAYCVGKFFKVDPSAMQDAVAQYHSGANRSEITSHKSCIIVKDAYNANPSSMELAIRAFAEKYPTGWVVLGDMKELGDSTMESHVQVMQQAMQYAFSKILLVGPAFQMAASAMHPDASHVMTFPDIETVKKQWDWEACKGQAILLKGSRSMHLEDLLT